MKLKNCHPLTSLSWCLDLFRESLSWFLMFFMWFKPSSSSKFDGHCTIQRPCQTMSNQIGQASSTARTGQPLNDPPPSGPWRPPEHVKGWPQQLTGLPTCKVRQVRFIGRCHWREKVGFGLKTSKSSLKKSKTYEFILNWNTWPSFRFLWVTLYCLSGLSKVLSNLWLCNTRCFYAKTTGSLQLPCSQEFQISDCHGSVSYLNKLTLASNVLNVNTTEARVNCFIAWGKWIHTRTKWKVTQMMLGHIWPHQTLRRRKIRSLGTTPFETRGGYGSMLLAFFFFGLFETPEEQSCA